MQIFAWSDYAMGTYKTRVETTGVMLTWGLAEEPLMVK
jgi:hypothetical protein